MSQGGLPITASKPASGRRRAVGVEEHLGKLELPVEQALRRAAIAAAASQVAAGEPARGSAPAAGEDQRPTARRTPTAGTAPSEPANQARTTGRRRASICDSAASRRPSAASARSFARTCSMVSPGVCSRREPDRQRRRGAPRRRRVVEQRQRVVAVRARRLGRRRRPAKLREPGAEQAVAGLQMVIEKRQRPVGGERRQPERQPRELHRHRVDVDAEQTSLGDRPPDRRRARARRSRWRGSRPSRTSAAS